MLNIGQKLQNIVFICLALFIACNVFAQNQNKPAKFVDCRIPFEVNKWNVDSFKIEKCFLGLKREEIRSFDIYATASPDGYTTFNKILSKNRTKNIAKEIQRLFPGVRINTKAPGQSRALMRAAYVVAVLGGESAECPKVAPAVCPIPKPVDSKPVEVVKKSCPVCADTTAEDWDFWVWGGMEAVFVVGDLSQYLTRPVVGFQGGFAKGIHDFEGGGSLYFAAMFDMATSVKDIGVDSFGFLNSAVFYYSNIQALLGYEHKLTSEFGLFGELGVAYMSRSFILRQNSSTATATDYIVTNAIGVGLNLGLNLRFLQFEHYSLFLRGGLNIVAGPKESKTLSLISAPTTNINANAWAYAPFISLGVKF